ncbi:hypothetical protein [Roseospira navarrensis]|uniref:Uncharacterized protein n=1 Tax=Roseospira navarrensis TaxID=140058 RepID=A0A7X1ZI78_9PROT|nr:hypothetical protein [Roseospira navarrensis]MQX38071.1 hypothetical protein [Roseospira navarrensis]
MSRFITDLPLDAPGTLSAAETMAAVKALLGAASIDDAGRSMAAARPAVPTP